MRTAGFIVRQKFIQLRRSGAARFVPSYMTAKITRAAHLDFIYYHLGGTVPALGAERCQARSDEFVFGRR